MTLMHMQWIDEKAIRSKIAEIGKDVARPESVIEAAAGQVGVDLEDRPERLTPEQFVRLAAALQ